MTTTSFGGREKTSAQKLINNSFILKTKYIKMRDLIAYKHSWVFSSDILEEDNEKFRDFFG